MIPELGKYAGTVLSSYGVTIVLLLGLIGVSLRASRKSLKELSKMENQDG